MKTGEILSELEKLAPLAYQESYDNSGLIYGNRDSECTGVLLSLDCTEETVDEAIRRNCNLIVSHHPPIFSAVKKLSGATYPERTLIKAIRNDVQLYAIHTNLDNVPGGVNTELATRAGLKNLKILQPVKGTLRRLITFCPESHQDQVRNALFNAGAGSVGDYDQCSFNTMGTGTFRALEGADPYVGEVGKLNQEAEVKIETIFSAWQENDILKAMRSAHPYEEVAYDILKMENENQEIGAGMVGEIDGDLSEEEFLRKLKKDLDLTVIRHTGFLGRKVRKVAVCGGSGSFLLKNAMGAGADVFITGDFKYHQFFDAEGKILIADIGHFESERFTVNLLERVISEKFRNFAVLISDHLNNPVKYLI